VRSARPYGHPRSPNPRRGRAISGNPEPHRRNIFDDERDAQSTSRDWPSITPPAIQKIADIESQTAIRIAFMRVRGRDGGVDSHRNIVLPTRIAA
jgi:hypothetical protein